LRKNIIALFSSRQQQSSFLRRSLGSPIRVLLLLAFFFIVGTGLSNSLSAKAVETVTADTENNLSLAPTPVNKASQGALPGAPTGMGDSTWKRQNPLPQGNNTLNGISCPSTTICFAVGSNGTIVATSNGGTTWTAQTSGTPYDLKTISCPSATTYFAVGYWGTIVATSNGGTTWTTQTSGTTDELRGISCPSVTTSLGMPSRILCKEKGLALKRATRQNNL
jgi:hypothetical protein